MTRPWNRSSLVFERGVCRQKFILPTTGRTWLNVLRSAAPPDSPIVLLGFSMGAAAAIHVAQKLGSVGIPVSKIVMVEAWNPEPVPANVAEATHFYSTRIATPIKPAPENHGTVENVDLNGRIPGIEHASHVSMSQMMSVQGLVIDKAGIDGYDTRPDHDLSASASNEALPGCRHASATRASSTVKAVDIVVREGCPALSRYPDQVSE